MNASPKFLQDIHINFNLFNLHLLKVRCFELNLTDLDGACIHFSLKICHTHLKNLSKNDYDNKIPHTHITRGAYNTLSMSYIIFRSFELKSGSSKFYRPELTHTTSCWTRMCVQKQQSCFSNSSKSILRHHNIFMRDTLVSLSHMNTKAEGIPFDEQLTVVKVYFKRFTRYLYASKYHATIHLTCTCLHDIETMALETLVNVQRALCVGCVFATLHHACGQEQYDLLFQCIF